MSLGIPEAHILWNHCSQIYDARVRLPAFARPCRASLEIDQPVCRGTLDLQSCLAQRSPSASLPEAPSIFKGSFSARKEEEMDLIGGQCVIKLFFYRERYITHRRSSMRRQSTGEMPQAGGWMTGISSTRTQSCSSLSFHLSQAG